MTIRCEKTRSCLGEWLDGELDSDRSNAIDRHLEECATCRAEAEALRSAVAAIARPSELGVPEELWHAIESRLDASREQPTRAERPRPTAQPRWRSLAAAAVIILAVGFGWFAWNPGHSTALAATIDFRPLLEKADSDIDAGIDALIRSYGGEATTLAEAAARMHVRIHPPAELPGGMRLKSLHLLNMGRHHKSLAFHFTGSHGHLLLLQCPAGVKREYGNHECLPCSVGAHDGHAVRVGSLHLLHMESENVCVCVVSTLDEKSELPAALDAIRIDF